MCCSEALLQHFNLRCYGVRCACLTILSLRLRVNSEVQSVRCNWACFLHTCVQQISHYFTHFNLHTEWYCLLFGPQSEICPRRMNPWVPSMVSAAPERMPLWALISWREGAEHPAVFTLKPKRRTLFGIAWFCLLTHSDAKRAHQQLQAKACDSCLLFKSWRPCGWEKPLPKNTDGCRSGCQRCFHTTRVFQRSLGKWIFCMLAIQLTSCIICKINPCD